MGRVRQFRLCRRIIPKITEGTGIYNIGFENDAVYRAGGVENFWLDGLKSALDGNDANYLSTTDNIILYDNLQPLHGNDRLK